MTRRPLIHDPARHKLGCAPLPHDPKLLDGVLSLSSYLDLGILPIAPAARSWLPGGLAWGMMRNDVESCCTIAAKAHMVQTWTFQASGGAITIPDDQVEAAYRAVSPGDTGSDLLTVQQYFRNVGIGGHRSWAYARAIPQRPRLVMESINLFGSYDLGLYLPVSAQHQDVWDVPPEATHGDGAINSWGGHNVACFSYDPGGVYCITWGQVKMMTWRFVTTYGMDGYATLSLDWLRPDKRAPNGFNLAHLKADVPAIGRG